MNKVFISYVSENIEIVDRLCQELKSHSIQFWRDRDDIDPGARWKQEIRRAIQQGGFFIACFSKEYTTRDKTYMNEELTIAIDALRQRPTDRAWFIPVKLNECEIPDRDIGGGETLRDLQHVNLYEDWDSCIRRIVKVVQPPSSEPVTNANTSEERIDQNARVEFSEGLAYLNSVSETSSLGERKEKHEKAIMHYSRALELKPDYVDAYNARGMIYAMWNKIDLALKDFGMAIKLRPDYFVAHLNRGVVHRNDGRYEQALQDFGKVIELEPNVYAGYSNRGEVYRLKSDFDRAIVDYNRAIQLKPDYAEAYNDRGITYANKGEVDRAIVDYTEAIELKPSLAGVYYNRGVGWLHLGEWEKAKADLMTAKSMGVDIIAAFRNDYKSVEAYERGNRVKLPEDIAAMLTQRRRSRFPKTEKILSSDSTTLESPDELNLLAELLSAGKPLSQYVQARPTFGLRTGASGAFVLDSATRDRLIAEHPSSADILKPFLHGRDIRRWQVARPDSWLIFTYRRIEINRYPAIRKHLEKYRSALRKRAGKQKWYELPATKSDAEHFVQTKLICPNSYDHQTFAVDTEGFYCGDTCYLIPTAESWLCGLLNSRVVEWFYSQTSNQLTGDYLQARSRYMQEIPIPDLSSTQKAVIGKIVDYLIFLQGQPTTSSGDLAHARDAVMLRYFERIIDGLVYESYLREELHHGDKQFFKPLLDERLPQIEEIRGDKMFALQEIFERLYERTHPIRRNLFFLDSVKPIRIIEGKA